ncbi:MAG: NAD(P)-binding domain-containing protein, partial [Prolixibacteraceae bacterium]
MGKHKKTVSILGCGWLGTALGRKLMTKGYNVKGSTATAESYVQLETTGIDTYHLKVEPEQIIVDYTHFFNADVLVISFPPKRNENVAEDFPKKTEQVARLIQEVNVQKVLFVSSTSVYESTNKEVREGE